MTGDYLHAVYQFRGLLLHWPDTSRG